MLFIERACDHGVCVRSVVYGRVSCGCREGSGLTVGGLKRGWDRKVDRGTWGKGGGLKIK